MSTEKHYEMLWDCEFCGTQKNLGLTHRFCPNCGAPQDPKARYYPSDAEKVAVEDHQFVGADVTCMVCNTLNSASAEFCGNCGASLETGVRSQTLDAQTRSQWETFEVGESRDRVKEEFDAEMQRIGVQSVEEKPKRSGGINLRTVGIIGTFIAMIAGIGFVLNWTEAVDVLVTGHEWERTIEIQEYSNFRTDSWRDTRPAGDNMSIVFGSCRQEQRSSRQVPDGKECSTVRQDNGDGTFSERQQCTTKYRTEPIYDDMCTWSGQRWQFERNVEASGTSVSDTPYWPQVTLSCEDQRQVGCERISSRDEDYIVQYRGVENDRNYQCEFGQDQWASVPIESRWTGQVRVIDDGGLRCDGLERAG